MLFPLHESPKAEWIVLITISILLGIMLRNAVLKIEHDSGAIYCLCVPNLVYSSVSLFDAEEGTLFKKHFSSHGSGSESDKNDGDKSSDTCSY